MDVGSLFFILALLILVALYLSQPFRQQRRQPMAYSSRGPVGLTGNQEHQLSALLAERDRILNTLQELDFDYAMGKIAEEDYPAQRALLLRRGADVLRGIDALQNAYQTTAAPSEQVQDVEERLEAEIASRRRIRAGAAAYSSDGHRGRANGPDDDLETEIALRRRARRDKAAGFCPQCGGPVQRSDLFCPKCGTRQHGMRQQSDVAQ